MRATSEFQPRKESEKLLIFLLNFYVRHFGVGRWALSVGRLPFRLVRHSAIEIKHQTSDI